MLLPAGRQVLVRLGPVRFAVARRGRGAALRRRGRPHLAAAAVRSRPLDRSAAFGVRRRLAETVHHDSPIFFVRKSQMYMAPKPLILPSYSPPTLLLKL